MHWYSHVWYPHTCAHTWMMKCLLARKLNWSCSRTLMHLNVLTIVLVGKSECEIGVMCTRVLNCSYACMLSWSHACMFTCFVDNLLTFVFALMITCSHVYLLWWSHAHLPVCLHAHMLGCFDDYLILFWNALIFTCLISTHMCTHLDDEMSIGSKAKLIV